MNYETCTEIEIAIAKHFGFVKNHIVPNISYGLNIHECDMFIVSKSNYVTEVEIKISKADLKKDKTKSHGHEDERIKYFYYAIPEKIIPVEFALANIPDRAGLIVVNARGLCTTKREATVRKGAKKLTDAEVYQVMRLGCMRQWTLKSNIVKSSDTHTELKNQKEIIQQKHDSNISTLKELLPVIDNVQELQQKYDSCVATLSELLPVIDVIQELMPADIEDPAKWIRECIEKASKTESLKI